MPTRRSGVRAAAAVVATAIVALGVLGLGARPAAAADGICRTQGQGHACDYEPSTVTSIYGVVVGSVGPGYAPTACQSPGSMQTDSSGDTSSSWAWVTAPDGAQGWASELYMEWGDGGDVPRPPLPGIPACGSSHGPAPGTPGYPRPRPVRHRKPVRVNDSCTRPQTLDIRMRFHLRTYLQVFSKRGHETDHDLAPERDVTFADISVTGSPCRTGVRGPWTLSSYHVHVGMQGINPYLPTPAVLGGPAGGWGLSLETVTPPEELYEPIFCGHGNLPTGGALLSSVVWGFPGTISVSASYPLGETQLPDFGIKCESLGGYGFEPTVSRSGQLGITAPNTTLVGSATSVSHSAGQHRFHQVVRTLEVPQIVPGVS